MRNERTLLADSPKLFRTTLMQRALAARRETSALYKDTRVAKLPDYNETCPRNM